MSTAVLVDGGFFLRRYRSLCGEQSPVDVAKGMQRMCLRHMVDRSLQPERRERHKLYRIFSYDCPPLQKKAHHPLTGAAVDFSKSAIARWRFTFFDELRRLRKVALRLGDLNEKGAYWSIEPARMKALLKRQISIDELGEEDVRYDVKQKGVDMRIGLDIASLCYKRFVDQIVLVAGDSDFVPAAKLARREGVDFILDPMWADIRPDLFEHIDGLRSVLPRPRAPEGLQVSQPTSDSTRTRERPDDCRDFGAGIDRSSDP